MSQSKGFLKVNNKRRPSRAFKRRGQPKMSTAALYSELNRDRMPESVNMTGPYPLSTVAPLRYINRVVVQAASPFVFFETRINAAFQPVVGGPTGTVSGFAGWSAIYNSYRVESYKLAIRVTSNEPVNQVAFGVIVSDIQPSTVITTYAQALTALGSSSTYFRGSVGATPGMSVFDSSLKPNPRDRVLKFAVGAAVGDQLMVRADRDFASQTTTNPNQMIWATFVAVSEIPGTNLTNGIILDWNCSMVTRFFSPTLIT